MPYEHLNIAEDETTICDVLDEDGLPCAREFPNELAWQEHFEDDHLGAEENDL